MPYNVHEDIGYGVQNVVIKAVTGKLINLRATRVLFTAVSSDWRYNIVLY